LQGLYLRRLSAYRRLRGAGFGYLY
jgi:hypothetical protein